MNENEAVEYRLDIGSGDATEGELVELTYQLLHELKQTDVESAELLKGDSAPAGTKGDPVTTASIAMLVLPALLPKIVEVVQAWVLRGSNRTVKFKGKINGEAVEFEGSQEGLEKLLASLPKGRGKK